MAEGRKKKGQVNKCIHQQINKKMLNNHLLGQAYFQKAWSRSSEGPAGLQEESSARFLVKEEHLEQTELGTFFTFEKAKAQTFCQAGHQL